MTFIKITLYDYNINKWAKYKSRCLQFLYWSGEYKAQEFKVIAVYTESLSLAWAKWDVSKK